jgi:prolyl-tRNA synthetase
MAEAGEDLARALDGVGVRVMLDDRNASVGVKLTDAELIGVPTIVVVGRGVAAGLVELRDRATGDKRDVSLAEVAGEVVTLVRTGHLRETSA